MNFLSVIPIGAKKGVSCWRAIIAWLGLRHAARLAERAVAIQLDWFVVPLRGTPRNDKLSHLPAIASPGDLWVVPGFCTALSMRN
jgi:hypothetical protein